MQPARELRRIAGKMHDMHVAMEEIQRENEAERQRHQHRLEVRERESRVKEEEAECERIRAEATFACQRISQRYDSLVKFVTSCPRGNYEEFIEFLLMGGGRTENDVGEQLQEYFSSLLSENFYDEMSEYRKIWNDNLSLGLPSSISTRKGRKFVPAGKLQRKFPTSVDGNSLDPWQLAVERRRNFGKSIHNQLTHLDKERIKQGLDMAVGGVSKALRELQLAERLKAHNLQGSDRCNNNMQDEQDEDEREAEELARLKREAIDTCLNATTEHLLEYIKEHPSAKYHEWIEDLHPENAYEGALLEGLGKTIDHRFYVEVSDHRRIWNENLFTFLDSNCSIGRDFVPARARHIDDNGNLVVAPDILSGFDSRRELSAPQNTEDLIEFD
ncbi:hypothetical protein ACHAXH_007624 [Discostella pseudostelligera]